MAKTVRPGGFLSPLNYFVVMLMLVGSANSKILALSL